MAVRILQGQNINITKNNPGIKRIRVKLGWDYAGKNEHSMDLDSSLFLCDKKGRALSSKHFIFYNNMQDPDGSVRHLGDYTNGADGEEQIVIELQKLSYDVEKIVFAASIHDADKKNQYFGMVSCSYLKIIDDCTQEEIFRFDLKQSFSNETAIILGEMYLENGDWRFKTSGKGFENGLRGMVIYHGLL